MSLASSYLEYAQRRYGMDHERYTWSMLAERAPVQWPDGAKLAVWINVGVQFFPLNQSGKPFPPPGGMTTAYPDLRHYTLRDYGNRVGIFRCLQALDRAGLRATFSVNAELAERYPRLLERLAERGDEILGSSWNMDTLHHSGMTESEERELVERSLGTLRSATGQAIAGWLSPARAQSHRTPDLLAANGVTYMGDWVNDDMPYAFGTSKGALTALPLSYELEDVLIVHNNLHSEWEYATQIKDAVDYLLEEAATSNSPRLLALSVHPWLMGQPHRIAALEDVLAHIATQSGIWSASAGEIVACWSSQQPGTP